MITFSSVPTRIMMSIPQAADAMKNASNCPDSLNLLCFTLDKCILRLSF